MKHVLVIADEHTGRAALASRLLNAGWVAHSAPRGHVARLLIATTCPDLVITNMINPRPGDQTLLTWMQQYFPATPIIVLSTMANPAPATSCFALFSAGASSEDLAAITAQVMFSPGLLDGAT